MKLKNKYQRMTKDQKHALLVEYKSTEKGKFVLKKLRNVFIIGVVLYAYSIYTFITAKNKWEYAFCAVMFLSGCVFLIGSIRLKTKNLTKFAVKKK